jgi:predicted anti-sigma-YlaC factor YlaD
MLGHREQLDNGNPDPKPFWRNADVLEFPADPSNPYVLGNDSEDENPTCRMVSANLPAYLDQELSPAQQNLAEAHLASCGDCAAVYHAMKRTDSAIQREWREEASLPSSSERRRSIDAIMASLPAAPETRLEFTPKRVHEKARWMRFATGTVGAMMAVGLLLSSYMLGYANGRRSQPASSLSAPASRALSVAPTAYLKESPQ